MALQMAEMRRSASRNTLIDQENKKVALGLYLNDAQTGRQGGMQVGKFRIWNAKSNRVLYAKKHETWESGVGAGPKHEVCEDGDWKFVEKAEGIYRILNAKSDRVLYAKVGAAWASGFGAGPSHEVFDDGYWKLVEKGGGLCRIINAKSNRALYAKVGTTWENGVGAGPDAEVHGEGDWKLLPAASTSTWDASSSPLVRSLSECSLLKFGRGSSSGDGSSSSDEDSQVVNLQKRGRWFCVAVLIFVVAIIASCLLFNDPKKAYQHLVNEQSLRSNMVSLIFGFGIFIVAIEDLLRINKSAVILVTSTVMWTVHAETGLGGYLRFVEEERTEIQNIGTVVLFVMPAMAAVELADFYGGFALATRNISRLMNGEEKRLLPIISFLTFFLCSVNDNLTSTLVALKIIRHVAQEDVQWRRTCAGMVVIAANAGATWSPIFDVTTVLEPATGTLWTRGKITALSCSKWLFLPALMSMVVPMVGICWQAPSSPARDFEMGELSVPTPKRGKATSRFVFAVGFICILGVPLLKFSLGLEAYIGMMLALGLMWLVVESRLVATSKGSSPSGDSEHHSSVEAAFHKMDISALLFMVGMLLAVGLLTHCGVLHTFANTLISICGRSLVALCSLLGASSAIADNAPLISETVNLFADVDTDEPLWQLIALAASTGASITSFGSIAGVALMSTEGVSFLWYFKWVTPWAILGFFSGIATYQMQRLALG